MKLPKRRKFKPDRIPILDGWRIDGTLMSREADGGWWLHSIDNEDYFLAITRYLSEHQV
jgi:hypothetical protein